MWISLNKDEVDTILALSAFFGTPAAKALATKVEEWAKPGPHDQQYRDAADDPFGEINIDDDAVVSVGVGGASVMAWVWVSDSDAGVEDVEDEEEDDDEDMAI